MKNAALAQSCVSPQNTDRNNFRIDANLSKWGIDVWTLSLYYISWSVVHTYLLKFSIYDYFELKALISLVFDFVQKV